MNVGAIFLQFVPLLPHPQALPYKPPMWKTSTKRMNSMEIYSFDRMLGNLAINNT